MDNIPKKKTKSQYSCYDLVIPETKLWRMVLLQSFIDLLARSKAKIFNVWKQQTIEWFDMNNENFVIVCNYADRNPEYVYQKARNLIEIIDTPKFQELGYKKYLRLEQGGDDFSKLEKIFLGD
jgi:hypothetical protein